MWDNIKRYTTEIAANIENEGEAIKDYESMLHEITDGIHCAKESLKRREEYDNDEEINKDEILPPMTEDEVAECRLFIAAAEELADAIREIISDELNHTMILLGKLAKFGKIKPASDGLALAVQEIVMTGDNE